MLEIGACVVLVEKMSMQCVSVLWRRDSPSCVHRFSAAEYQDSTITASDSAPRVRTQLIHGTKYAITTQNSEFEKIGTLSSSMLVSTVVIHEIL